MDNASRVLTQVQEKLEGLAKAGERMKAIGEGVTFAGGLIRAAGDALGWLMRAREVRLSSRSYQLSAGVTPPLPLPLKGEG
ncbi:MAG: hypothetical protein JO071_15480 [Deltaproteobacteria bacterium]|nr:hypothetical protein [Deltaproteobacteria bacterium]